MLNTYGLKAINSGTFNQHYDSTLKIDKEERNEIIFYLKVHNLVLNVLGYLPYLSFYSGCVRMVTGLSLCVTALFKGDPRVEKNAESIFDGHWRNEAVLTGIAQIVRGALEAFIPFGHALNCGLDIYRTIQNVAKELNRKGTGGHQLGTGMSPHPDPQLPQLLIWV